MDGPEAPGDPRAAGGPQAPGGPQASGGPQAPGGPQASGGPRPPGGAQPRDSGQVALVVGEALVDVVVLPDGTTTAYPGGSAANVAVALARLERPAWFSTCFADDEYGRLIGSQLARAGVRLASDPAAADHTSSARATIGTDGAATYEFDLAWRLNPLTLDESLRPVVVHTSSLGAVLAPGADDVVAIVERLRATATISYDVNARPGVTGTGPEIIARVERLAALADVVKASDEDLEALWPDRSLDESARHLLASGPSLVVVTRGAAGARWVAPGAEGETDAVPVAVADTIGAGDTFGAALLDGLWGRDLLGAEHRDSLTKLPAETWGEVLGWAARVSAVTVSRPGADPPYRHEIG